MTTPQPTVSRLYKPVGSALQLMLAKEGEVILSGSAGTGKSRGCLEKLHLCAMKYPKMRGLIVRKTRESITQSAIVTFEQHVLPEGWLGSQVRWRTTEQEYRYWNGSSIAVVGLDKPTKVMSSERDIIYVQEAIELLENDFESLTTRLRNGVMPYQQIIGDTNPDAPTHWLYQRYQRGQTRFIECRHEDNPRLYDSAKGQWTAEGRFYLEDILDKLTGVRKERLRYGKWVAAEGLVYDEWQPNIHIVERHTLPAIRQAARWAVAGVDWGYTNPGVIEVGLVDGDGRIAIVAEVYMTQKTIEWWIATAKRLAAEWGISVWACDPSEPAFIEAFQREGLSAVKADNSIAPGVQAVKEHLTVAGDGRPRLVYMRDSLTATDPVLVERKKPIGFLGEIPAYVWDKSGGRRAGELPVKKDDHAMDAGRYLTMQVAQPMPSDDSGAYDESDLYTSAATHLRY